MPNKPMRKLIAALLLTSITMPLHAQLNPALARQPAAKKAAAPATEGEKKPDSERRSFLQRMFGSHPKPTPTPAPAPEVKHHPKSRPKHEPAEMPAEAAPKAAKTGATPATPVTTTKPKTGRGAKKGTPTGTAATPADEAAKFKAAKAHALEDAHIKDLKSKADGEVNEAEAHKALVNYNRALFQKIREVDPSVTDYAGKVEQAMTKRIGAEKGGE
ncbi:MAG: hypothetical protein ABI318_14770 [Chthoniobacteraceae bacterium]